ncbi:MAG: hypothetical protein QM785_20320 [Pyrinomonadaceae bacterium]
MPISPCQSPIFDLVSRRYKMIKPHLIKLAALLAMLFAVSFSADGQATPMNQFELASHARAAARSFSDGEKYEAALAVLNSLETGKYEIGDAGTQAAAAKVQGVQTDKGRIFIKLRRYAEADDAFYKAFDANLVPAEKDLEYVREHGNGGFSAQGTKAAEAYVSAVGALQRANSVVELREASYLLAGASNVAKPFDPARIAKYDSLKKGLAKFMQR